MRITPFWITLLAVNAHATLILSTDFTGRTVNGKTAENIPWTTGGIQDPGDLTWVVETGTTTNTDLFDTGAAQNHFAPDLNIHNEGFWSVTIPLVLTTPRISLENVVIDWRDFSNTGVFQGSGRDSQYTVSVTGSISGLLDTVDTGVLGSTFGRETLPFTTPLELTDGENYDVLIFASGSGPGNNTGLNAVELNGSVIPEPSSVGLAFMGITLLVRARKSQ